MTIAQTVESWPGVEGRPHRFGGREFRLGRTEFGHAHGDRLVDVPFPRRVRDALVDAGEAEVHHVLTDSGWVSFRVRGDGDADAAIRLLRLAYLLRLAGVQRRGQETGPSHSVVDAAAELGATTTLPDDVLSAVTDHLNRAVRGAEHGDEAVSP